MVIAAFAATANAQFWVGGGVGFNSNSTKNIKDSKTVSNRDSLILSVSPKVGFRINKVDVGAKFTYATAKAFPDKEKSDDDWSKTTSLALSVFARYGFANVGDLWFRVVTDLSCGLSKPETSKGSKNGEAKKTEGNKTQTVAFNLYPMLSYSLSDHFELEADLNFLGLSASLARTDTGDDKVDSSVNHTNVGLTINNGNIATSSIMNIGFIFKF